MASCPAYGLVSCIPSYLTWLVLKPLWFLSIFFDQFFFLIFDLHKMITFYQFILLIYCLLFVFPFIHYSFIHLFLHFFIQSTADYPYLYILLIKFLWGTCSRKFSRVAQFFWLWISYQSLPYFFMMAILVSFCLLGKKVDTFESSTYFHCNGFRHLYV